MNEPLRVFLDSNVLLSASFKGSNRFQPLWTLANVDILTSQYSIGEVTRHLKSPEQRARLWHLIYKSHLVPEGDETTLPASFPLHSKDLPILRAAIAGKADVLVTGDSNHFGKHYGQRVQGVTIESPAMFRTRFSAHFDEQLRGQ